MKPEVIGAVSVSTMFLIGFVIGWFIEPGAYAIKAFNGTGWGMLLVGSMVYPNTFGKLIRSLSPGI